MSAEVYPKSGCLLTITIKIQSYLKQSGKLTYQRMSAAPSDPDSIRSSVFYVHLKRDIDAPVEKVWDVLTDLPKYHEWNPFVRQMIITDSSKRANDEQVLEVDKYLLMLCHIPPFKTKVFERIAVVDPQNHRLSWANIDYPSWALRAERWQVLTSVDGGGTHYETWEAFDGVLAYFVRWFIGRKLKQSFGVFADGLQARADA